MAAFVFLSVVTVLVWRSQVGRQQQLLARHAEDVAFQASLRLQVFVESHLKMASVFAKRWATHETQDFSQKRFEKFGTVMIAELPGYYAISLLSPDNGHWTVPASVDHAEIIKNFQRERLFEETRAAASVLLSGPVRDTAGHVSFFATLPLRRGHDDLGFLMIQFQAKTLIDDCFHEKIRSEFDFVVEDKTGLVYRFTPDGDQWMESQESTGQRVSFRLHNRQWILTVVPQKRILNSSGWVANLAVPALGFPVTVALAWLVWLLLRRMEMLRIAKDRAVLEVEERRRAESALQVSQARHAQLSRKILMAQEEERSRLSRELHDELGQILTALRFEMGLLGKTLASASESKSHLVDNAVKLVETSAEELRRICRGLRPPLLDDLGLEPALHMLTRDFVERTGITVDFDMDFERADDIVTPEVALATYRIMQEALNNVSRHAKTMNVSVSIFRTNDELQLSIEDHGVGFDPDALSPQDSCGIQGMRERAHLVLGTLSVSSSIGDGTSLVFRVPLKQTKGESA